MTVRFFKPAHNVICLAHKTSLPVQYSKLIITIFT